MPFAGLIGVCRLVRISACSQIQFVHTRALINIPRSNLRRFSSGRVNYTDKEREDSLLSTKLPIKQALSRRRPLSPLERISSLLPQDALSPEVMQLRQGNQHEPDIDTSVQVSGTDCIQEDDVGVHTSDAAATSATIPGESLLAFGELLVAEYRKKGRVEFRKMFRLQAGTRLQSNWGTILHDNIARQPAGRILKTSRGFPILVRRASLEDYVLFMRRGPAITYPKDAGAMLMMMDVTEGDIVLESGSGSGAMSLFLSRAVGSTGRVLSVEVREDHHRRAVLNYKHWRTSWSLRRGEEWPDNVQFHNTDLCTASSLLAGEGFNAVALDLINPHLVLHTVIPHLHPGAVCAVYLANISQVIDLLEGLRCLALHLLCERIIEVPVRDWLVAPALQKNGQYCTRKDPVLPEEQEDEMMSEENDKGELTMDIRPAFGSIPYIARPHPEQMSHTAFLVKLRKHVQ